ncbi:MAG: HD domain-containing protein [Proteobacteria bacterium]|nr:HD domain-containing protein [Pseudomonadota bacterium]
MEAVSQVIGEKAEFVWKQLPPEIGKPLTITVEEYQKLSDAIASGEPINCSDAADSCLPLVDAINNGNHHAVLKAVQSHHNYTYVHSMRVATLLTLFAHGIGIKGDDLLVISTGGLIHDVGKLVTPDQILDKPGKLTDEEWPIMRDHVTRSKELLGDATDISKGALIIAGQHHEKLDGSGYPLGLKGAELNELARMSVIVDIFGALTDARSYKPPFPQEKAFGILEEMGDKLDRRLLKVFRAIFEPGSDKLAKASSAMVKAHVA